MALGIFLLVLTCAVAFGIGAIAAKNIREFDESKHESFLGK
ncbi:hypothetical protein [Ferviditalea candida]|uniref:Uncharacterized protein n=1 Tax=Ferviditalea candida TaxID=3108399 RepID=A0ABU5ZJW7_9BACL|nr:hypothetical protein [Paenibacillaceae bacterium T2]